MQQATPGAALPAKAGAVLALWLAVILAAPALAAPPAKALEWDFTNVGLKGKLYPSLMMSMATMHLDVQDKPNELGDRNGLFGVSVKSPRAGAKVVVEITSSSPLVNTGRAEVTLPKKGQEYIVYPYLSYPESLAQVRQPVSIVMTAKLTLDGEPMGERPQRVVVASVNDCVYEFLEDSESYDTPWLFAAYVNENHPAVQSILREALALEEVSSFAGYQGDADDVLEEVKAIWQALRKRGMRYSSINRASAQDADVGVQHVRLLGEALAGRQANCVEGSCLLASVFYKIGLETSLVVLPTHMLVGVSLDAKGKEQLYLETTMLANSSFEDAAQEGNRIVEKALKKARKAAAKKKKKTGKEDTDNDLEPVFIEISQIRQAGIMPIPDHEASRAGFVKSK